MAAGKHLDTNAIHALLWERVDRHHRVRLQQKELADTLGITKFTMSRTISRMVDEKRIRRISGGRHNEGMFVIEDPTEWELWAAGEL